MAPHISFTIHSQHHMAPLIFTPPHTSCLTPPISYLIPPHTSQHFILHRSSHPTAPQTSYIAQQHLTGPSVISAEDRGHRASLTTTTWPLCSFARCACPIEAAPSGLSANVAKTSSRGQPSSLSIMLRITATGCGGTFSCSDLSLSIYLHATRCGGS